MNAHKKFPFRQELFNFPCSHFKEHLSIEDNNRILFSGKFGIGKSYFIDHFFKDETQTASFGKPKYKAFHIYPVNYSISSNEDVFRYIKYDVISSMLLNSIYLDERDISYLETIPDFLKKNAINILKTFIGMMPKIGKDIVESHDKLIKLIEDFEKLHNEKASGGGDILINFLDEEEKKAGSIFENDLITKLIQSILTQLKQKTGHENVLIIDDLDRIDPEHTFRLLNIFAAHLDDPKEQPNKLGFDKVIIVCDINNLKNIFSAKYGSQTDFNGYIDKFYSHEIYHIDNKEILLNIAHEAFKSVEFKNEDSGLDSYYISQLFKSNTLALELLQILISYGFISLRGLIQRITAKIQLDAGRYIRFDNTNLVLQLDVPILAHFRILKEIVGDYNILKEYINRIPLQGFLLQDTNKYSRQLAFFIHYDKTFRGEGSTNFSIMGKIYRLTYSGNKLVDKLSKLQSLPITGDHFQLGGNHKYTIEEFLVLLNDFIDLLKRIEN